MGKQVIWGRREAAGVCQICRLDRSYNVVGKSALKNNIKVRSIVLPEIQVIENQAFQGCTSLKKVSFPNLITLKREAFSGCSNLKSITFPDTLTRVEESAFGKCKRIEEVSFCDRHEIKCIPAQMFAECRELSRISLPGGVETVGTRAFYKCESLREICLPDSVKGVGREAFYQCGFQELILPEQLEDIGDSAFLKCKNLEYVRIPVSVRKIGRWAFHGCGRLKVLEFCHDPDEVGDWITNKNCVIRCRQGSAMEQYALRFGIHVVHF